MGVHCAQQGVCYCLGNPILYHNYVNKLEQTPSV